MTRYEFIKGLEEALLEQMDISEAAIHIKYYQDYIENEMKKGRSEEDVINSLQNPRLIAKNIVDNGSSARKYNNVVSESIRNDHNESASNKSFMFSFNGKPVNSIMAKLLVGAILLLALILVLVIVSGILWIIFTIVLPVMIILGVIYIVMKLIKNGKQ